MGIGVLDPLPAASAQSAAGELPESMYLQPPVGSCSSCKAPLFEREGDWAEDTRCYTCWAIDRNEYSHVLWTPPRPYCTHCGDSTLGNTSGYCDECIVAACGSHTQTVLVKDKETGQPLEGASVNGGVFQNKVTDSSGQTAVSGEHMHLSGTTDLTVTCQGYQGQKLTTPVLSLAETLTVELEPLPDSFSIPIQAVQFAGEAFGPVALDVAAQLDYRSLPMKIDNLISQEVTVTRDPATGNYTGNIKLDKLAQLLFDGALTLTGNVTARWNAQTSRLELVNADIDASINLSADIGRIFGGVSGELVPNIHLSGDYDENGELVLIPQVTCSGSVYAYLGPKLEHTVKIGRVKTKLEAEVNGGVQFNLRAELANGHDIKQDFVQLTGNLQARLKILGLERNIQGPSWQYYPVVEEDAGELPQPAEPVYRFPSRNESGTGDSDSQTFHPDAPPSAPTPDGSPVVDDSGDSADPVIVPIGGGTIAGSGSYRGTAVMFWLQDAAARQDINRYQLVYSRFDGNTWSAPVPVHDDGTADYAPRAVTIGDTVYLIWQNADKEFTGIPQTEEYALSMDIYAAVLKDGSIQNITNLTEGINGYCGMHSLAVEDGKVTASWVANSQGSLLFEEGNNTGFQAVFEDGGWNTQQAALDSASLTGKGRPILQLLASGGEDEQDGSVEAAGITFYRTQDGSVACMENGQEKLLAAAIPAASFEAVSNGKQVFLYWLSGGQDGAVRLEGVFYDPASGEYSQPEAYLNHGGNLHGINASMDESGTVLVAYHSSQWQNIQQGSYQSTDLMTAAIPLPQELSCASLWWILLPVGGLVLAAGIIIALWQIRKKSKPLS